MQLQGTGEWNERAITVGVLLGIGTTALLQAFTNGDFETGDLSEWTVTQTANGHTHVQDVVNFDIDFNGPLGLSQVGRFQVAQLVYDPAETLEGIELTQMLNLVGGSEYTISFNAATYVPLPGHSAGNAGDFDLIVDGVSLANWVSPHANSNTQNWSFLTARFTPASNRPYSIGARIRRGYLSPDWLFQKVDNFTIVPEAGTFVALGIGTVGLLAVRRRR